MLADAIVLGLEERPLIMPEETGLTFEENALLKAEAALKAHGLWTLADDSGLEVDALGGAPGVRSARYAPGTDGDRCRALLRTMEGESNRSARFVCALALCRPGEAPLMVRGTCEGHIGQELLGEGGFGYDPVFMIEENRSMAMLTGQEKNRISHRGRALERLRAQLVLGFPAA